MELELLTDVVQEYWRTYVWNEIDPYMNYPDWDVLSRNVETLVNSKTREITTPVYGAMSFEVRP